MVTIEVLLYISYFQGLSIFCSQVPSFLPVLKWRLLHIDITGTA